MRAVERGDLEAAEVGREKDDAVAARARIFHDVPAPAFHDQPRDPVVRAEPDGEKLGDAFSRFGDRSAQHAGALRLVAAHAADAEIFPEPRRVGRRRPVREPAQRRPGAMQPGKRQARQQPEPRDKHEFSL
ncbi:hypothetical protein D3C83_04180 [compost metagenome]